MALGSWQPQVELAPEPREQWVFDICSTYPHARRCRYATPFMPCPTVTKPPPLPAAPALPSLFGWRSLPGAAPAPPGLVPLRFAAASVSSGLPFRVPAPLVLALRSGLRGGFGVVRVRVSISPNYTEFGGLLG